MFLVGFLSLVAAPQSAGAGADGHDHGAGTGARASAAPRAEARIADKQIVLVYAGGRLLAFVEGFADGVPTRGAELEAVINFLPETFAEVAPGIYQTGPVSLASGPNDIETTWKIDGAQGSATILFIVPASVAVAAGAPTQAPGVPGWVFAIAALVVYGAAMALFWPRRRSIRRRPPAPAPMSAAPAE